MWFGKRRALLANIDRLLVSSITSTNRACEDVKTADAMNRTFSQENNRSSQLVCDDDLRLLLVEQLAALLMAKENLMALQGKGRLFEIRDIYIPMDPIEFDMCVAKIWSRMWPNQAFPGKE